MKLTTFMELARLVYMYLVLGMDFSKFSLEGVHVYIDNWPPPVLLMEGINGLLL